MSPGCHPATLRAGNMERPQSACFLLCCTSNRFRVEIEGGFRATALDNPDSQLHKLPDDGAVGSFRPARNSISHPKSPNQVTPRPAPSRQLAKNLDGSKESGPKLAA